MKLSFEGDATEFVWLVDKLKETQHKTESLNDAFDVLAKELPKAVCDAINHRL